MVAHKATRSNPPAQPQPQRQRPNHQLKAELFDAFQRLNRGYGIAMARSTAWKPKTACKPKTARASSPPPACGTTATVPKHSAPTPTAIFCALSPDTKNRTLRALAGPQVGSLNAAPTLKPVSLLRNTGDISSSCI